MSNAPRDEHDNQGSDAAITLFVSDALQLRLDNHRDEHAERTNTSIVFEAIDALRDDVAAVVRDSRVQLASGTGETHDLGTGPVQIPIRPTPEQVVVLDELTRELDANSSTEWLPAVLNAYLPGRKEPENMPWLVQSAR